MYNVLSCFYFCFVFVLFQFAYIHLSVKFGAGNHIPFLLNLCQSFRFLLHLRKLCSHRNLMLKLFRFFTEVKCRPIALKTTRGIPYSSCCTEKLNIKREKKESQ